MTDRPMPRCRRTDRVVGAFLDGTDSTADRLHAAGCPACASATERARVFDRSLAAVALETADLIPDSSMLPSARRRGRDVARAAVRLSTLGAAVAAGLLIAALIGPRVPAPAQPGSFAPFSEVRGGLESLDLACQDAGAGPVCETIASGHAHRVELTPDDGVTSAATVTIENTDGKTLVRDGGDVLFAQVADVLLTPDAAEAVEAWLDEHYATCTSSCSAELDDVAISLVSDRTSMRLTFTDR